MFVKIINTQVWKGQILTLRGHLSKVYHSGRLQPSSEIKGKGVSVLITLQLITQMAKNSQSCNSYPWSVKIESEGKKTNFRIPQKTFFCIAHVHQSLKC